MTNADQDKTELLPCPCCGSTSVALGNANPLDQPQYWEWRVACVDCGLKTCTWSDASIPVARWNARPGNRSDA